MVLLLLKLKGRLFDETANTGEQHNALVTRQYYN